jgi:heme exporter protein C
MFKKIDSFIYYFALLFIFLSLGLIGYYAPVERTQEMVQKIFYFHVSSAFAMYFGFGLSGLAALIYLINKKEKWNQLSIAAASTGLLFCSMVLASGPIWAKPIWGTWWTWDPRLTTTLLIWLIFISVKLLREFFGNDPKGALYASILTLIGVLDIPLIFFSVKIWRGIHPTVLGEEGNMPSEMKLTLIISNIAILIFWAVLTRLRYRIEKLK